MKTIREMAEQLQRDIPQFEGWPIADVLDAMTPNGELFWLYNEYLARHWSEVLPSEVENPEQGALRQSSGHSEVWNGETWVPYAL